ncbi:hypothetical protein CRG98_025614 [Punica granatum]|uniref:Reverse transcriptase Ty1/copia-type domain-containing protein n=1 Tax=Punica granatum TaxID=22663 RepID=A0A2I0JDB9_PUNGR|nr:hypothetical protein CRG98_025614 [Punica granatum]
MDQPTLSQPETTDLAPTVGHQIGSDPLETTDPRPTSGARFDKLHWIQEWSLVLTGRRFMIPNRVRPWPRIFEPRNLITPGPLSLYLQGSTQLTISGCTRSRGKLMAVSTDLGPLRYFLSIEVAWIGSGLFLNQLRYVLDILTEFGMLGLRPSPFPMEHNHGLSSDSGDPLEDPSRYSRLVGRLIFLTITRLEISYSVNILTQFMQHARQPHWDATVRVLRFLKQSPAEYKAMAAVVIEIIWLHGLLACLGVKFTQPTLIFCDNQAAFHIAANSVFHEHIEHIEIDCNFVREHIKSHTIATSHVSTNLQLADIFIKALGRDQFRFILGKLGILDSHAST